MKNPKWYDQESVHKSVKLYLDSDLRIPMCKLAYRSEWPSDGVWDVRDKFTGVWKKVTCLRCRELKR